MTYLDTQNVFMEEKNPKPACTYIACWSDPTKLITGKTTDPGGKTFPVVSFTSLRMEGETLDFPLECTLKRQNVENVKQIFPEKEYRGLSPNFHIHVSVSESYIPTMGLPVLLEEICRLILGIYKSLKDT